MNELRLSPRLMTMGRPSQRARGSTMSRDTADAERRRLMSGRALDDGNAGAPRDYAADVDRMIGAARHPASIAAGLAGGIGAAYGIVRLQGSVTPLRRYGVPVLGGIVAGALTHGAASWLVFRSQQEAIADSAPSAMEEEALAVTHAVNHPLSLGIGIGTTIATGYGLWRWRNPPGARKARWAIPLFGSIIAGGMARMLTASILRRSSETGGDHLSGVIDVSNVGSTIVTAVTLVCMYGGAKYLYDTVRPRHARRSALSDSRAKRMRSSLPGGRSQGTRPRTSSPLPVVVP